MIWENVLDKDLLTVKLDRKDRSAILEVNDGGISPNYVTIRLQSKKLGN